MNLKNTQIRVGIIMGAFSFYVAIFNIILYLSGAMLNNLEVSCTISCLIAGAGLLVTTLKVNKATQYIQVILLIGVGVAIGLFGTLQWSPIIIIQLGAFCASFYNIMPKQRTFTILILYLLYFIVNMKFYEAEELREAIILSSKYASIQTIFVIIQSMLFRIYPRKRYHS